MSYLTCFSRERELEDAQAERAALKAECDKLKTEVGELSAANQKRRSDVKTMTRSLSDITSKLGNAEATWNPYGVISDVKQQVADIQSVVEKDTAVKERIASEHSIE